MSLWRTRYFSSSTNVSTSSPEIFPVNKRDLFQLNFLGSDRWIWSRCCDEDFNSAWARLPFCWWKGPLERAVLDIYQKCLGTFPILLVDPSAKTRLFRHLDNHVFRVPHFENTKAVRVIFFSKCAKPNVNFKNASKDSEKGFYLWDNFIWIGIVKLSL